MGETLVRGRFSRIESKTSSTFRELLAVKYSISSLCSTLSGQSVRVNVDNYSPSRILSIGSGKQHLQDLAIDIFKYCLAYNIRLMPRWVPRELNIFADYLSKDIDTDDWSIDEATFASISAIFGPFTIDRFADDSNAKLTRFNSKYHCPGT